MAAKSELQIEVKAIDKASDQLKKIGVNSKEMAANFAKAGAGMLAVGVAIVGGMAKMVNSYSQAGDEVAKMAERTGIGTESLSELRYILDLSGSSLDGFEKAVRTMQGAIVDGQAGMETYTRAFERIGIDVNTLKGMKPEDQFWLIANGIAAMADDTEKAATASDIFGARMGTSLLPMLAEGATKIADMKQEARDMNVVFDTETATACAAFEDSKTRLTTALGGIGNAIAIAVMPRFEDFVKMLTEKLKPAMAWLEEHPEVVSAFLKFGAIFGVTGAVFLAVSAFIKLINMSLIPAIFRAIVAWIGLLAVSGPAGWAILAGSVMVATAAIVALWEVLAVPLPSRPFPAPGGGQAVPPGYETWEEAIAAGILPAGPPSYQYGGIVPGRLGAPVPIIAHGGEMFAGVHGAYRGGAGVTVNLNIGGSVIAERDLVQTIRDEFLKIQARNVSLRFA